MKAYMVYTPCSNWYYSDITPIAFFRKIEDAEEFILACKESRPYEVFNKLLSYSWNLHEALAKSVESYFDDEDEEMKIKEVEVF